MDLRNTPLHFGLIARVFHWLMAVLIIVMLMAGLYMTEMPSGPSKLQIFGLHKSTGILILMLAAARLTWRFTNPVPRLPPGFPRIVYFGAHASHGLLYACMFAMPLTGWGLSSAGGRPVSFYGLFVLPDLVGPDKALGRTLAGAHEWIAYFLIGLIALHAAAALWHQFVRHDGVLTRMTSAILLLCVLLPPALRADEPPAHFTLVPEKSSLRFVANENGAPVEGQFNHFTADILFSPDHPEANRVEAEVDLASVASANDDMARELPGKDWFDAAQFPKAVFRSVTFHAQPPAPGNPLREYYIDGTLTLHGVSQPVTVNMTLEHYDAQSAVASGTFTVSRKAFGVGSGQWKDASAIRDEVTVKFRIAAKRSVL